MCAGTLMLARRPIIIFSSNNGIGYLSINIIIIPLLLYTTYIHIQAQMCERTTKISYFSNFLARTLVPKYFQSTKDLDTLVSISFFTIVTYKIQIYIQIYNKICTQSIKENLSLFYFYSDRKLGYQPTNKIGFLR